MEYGYARVSTKEQNEERQLLWISSPGKISSGHSIGN